MCELRTQLAEAHPEVVVWAAGGIVMRANQGELEVLLVHRPHRDDWSFPKGKLDPGETLRAAARREVEEESGFRCRLIERLPEIRYTDAKGREKLVVYWTMDVESGEFAPNDEVDSIEWCPLTAAEPMLTYERDVVLLGDILPAERQLGLLA